MAFVLPFVVIGGAVAAPFGKYCHPVEGTRQGHTLSIRSDVPRDPHRCLKCVGVLCVCVRAGATVANWMANTLETRTTDFEQRGEPRQGVSFGEQEGRLARSCSPNSCLASASSAVVCAFWCQGLCVSTRLSKVSLLTFPSSFKRVTKRLIQRSGTAVCTIRR
jgi:hypothetical protein